MTEHQFFEIPPNFGQCEQVWKQVRAIEHKMDNIAKHQRSKAKKVEMFLQLKQWELDTANTSSLDELKALVVAKKQVLGLK